MQAMPRPAMAVLQPAGCAAGFDRGCREQTRGAWASLGQEAARLPPAADLPGGDAALLTLAAEVERLRPLAAEVERLLPFASEVKRLWEHLHQQGFSRDRKSSACPEDAALQDWFADELAKVRLEQSEMRAELLACREEVRRRLGEGQASI